VRSAPLVIGLLSLALVLACAVTLGIGAVSIAPARSIALLLGGQATADADAVILRELRLPRVLLACVIGGGLGTAGAGYQALFRNPLADPFVIGASSGAALGATVAIILGLQATLFGLGGISLLALAGSLGAVALVYAIAAVGRNVSALSLLLAGVAVSSFISALVSLLMFLNDEKLVTIFGWLMGSLSGRGWSVLGTSVPLILLGSVSLWLLSRPLDALSFGEDTAASLGVRLAWLRGLVVVAASLSTAAGVAAGGIIAFVGLISPHVARALVGARHALLLPASGLCGAILLVIADCAARTVAAPAELPVGIVTALLGGPFFLVLLKLRQRELGGP
jgi:iron complex transport system permease protein